MRFTKYTYFLIITYCTTEVLSNSVITPCKIEDNACINTSAQAAIPKIFAGFPKLGIKSSDPLFIETIEGNLPGFKYVFYNTTVTGIKNCVVFNIKIDSMLTKLHYEMKCPGLKLEGEYEMNGQLITLPVEGNGHFTVTKGNHNVIVDSKLETIESDGKTHLSINKPKLKCEALAPVKYAFDNLYNGQKDKADAFHKSANENWKIVQEQAQGPVWQGIIENIIKNVNAYLKTITLQDLKLQ